MRIKLFSHTDLDGIGCNIITKSIMENLEYIEPILVDCENLNYDEVNESIEYFIDCKIYKNYDLILITDIRVNEKVAEKIDKIGKNKFLLLDHHPTALELNKYDWATVDIERHGETTSGTAMLFEELSYYLDDKSRAYLKQWSEYIRKYDTWLWKEKYNDIKPKELNDIFFILGKEKFIDEVLKSIKHKISVEDFIEIYRKELDEKQEKINLYITNKNKSMIKIDLMKNCLKCGVVFAEQYHSELGNKLSEMNKDCDFIMMVDGDKASLRTIKDNVNCGAIAESFGGGGHPKAAGFKIEDSIIHTFINNIFKQHKNNKVN